LLEGMGSEFGMRPGTDLVWPCPASPTEVARLHEEELAKARELFGRSEQDQAASQWEHAAQRQAKAEALLNAPARPAGKEPTWHGRLLSEVLRNDKSAGTNKLTLAQMLTLRQVMTGGEPETVTFEVPVSYDFLDKRGALSLYVDPAPDSDSDEGCTAGQCECKRATNGNCLLVWSTIFETPGKHAVRAGLDLEDVATRSDEEIVGPLMPFVISNLCQFSLSSAHFQHEFGVTLRGKLPEDNGSYSVELKSPDGQLLKTLSGSASNGFVNIHWDLRDEHGRLCTNDAFDTVFQITLPDSGRSQTLRGP